MTTRFFLRLEGRMSKFRFALSNIESRQEGIIESDSFTDAVFALGKHVSVHKGDRLEIGVNGFPPAHFECVGSINPNEPLWMPFTQAAA
jgi:hypothetical protein